MSALWASLGGAKWVIVTVAVCAVALAGIWLLRDYGKAKEATGASTVTTAVQTGAVKKQEEARQDKVKAEEVVRKQPIDDVIEGLK